MQSVYAPRFVAEVLLHLLLHHHHHHHFRRRRHLRTFAGANCDEASRVFVKKNYKIQLHNMYRLRAMQYPLN
jgi:hypothetical protein